MKKWVFGCAMALVITSCDNKKFSIQGRVADADGQVLYLESLAVNGTELLDSVELDKDGRFKFKYHAPQYPEFYQLRLDKSIIHLAIDSTETLNLSANAADFANDYELIGSDECVKMRIVAQESAKLKNESMNCPEPCLPIATVSTICGSRQSKIWPPIKRKCSIWYWKIRPRQLHIILFSRNKRR